MSCYRGWDLSVKHRNGSELNDGQLKEIRTYIECAEGDNEFYQIASGGEWNNPDISSFETDSNFSVDDVKEEIARLSSAFKDYVFRIEQFCWDYIDMFAIIAYQGKTETLEGRIEYEEPKEIMF